MKDTRFIKLIRTFSKEELKSFDKFLQSPYLKPARDTTELFYYISKFYPDYDNAKLEKEKVFKSLFKNESYNEKKLLNLIFDLTNAAEDFLALNTIMDDETEFLLNLSKGYMKKNLIEESNRVNKIIEKKLVPGFSQSKDYISKFRELSYLKSSYFTEIHDFEKHLLNEKDYFETSAVQFIIDYTRIIESVAIAQNTYGINLNSNFIDSVISSFDLERLLTALEKSDNKNKHLILLHYYILKSKLDVDNVRFYELMRDLFYELLPELDREERCFIFNHLSTYCARKFGKDKMFLKEGLEVYKKMLENNAYSESETEYMQVPTYRNILMTCKSLNETKWFEYFIEEYSDCLHPEFREDLKNYAYAHLFFMKKEFEKSLSIVSRINQDLFLFKPDLKNLMLPLYYELDHIEAAFSMVDSYKHFLANTKEVSESIKIYSVNFLGFYYNLLKIKSGQSKEKAGYFKDLIEKEKTVINRIWLLEKASELSKK